jgi:predicted site-specific integrase-resolvase
MSIMENQEKIYTATELCQRYGISRTTLQRRIDDGLITPMAYPVYLKRPGQTRFTESEVKRLEAEFERISQERAAEIAKRRAKRADSGIPVA